MSAAREAMICFYMPLLTISSVGVLRVLSAAVVLAAMCLGIVWVLRMVLGRRVARIAAYLILAALAALFVMFGVECREQLAVPIRFEGDQMISNEGVIRGLIFDGAVMLPAALLAAVVLGLSDWLFFRAPRRLNNG